MNEWNGTQQEAKIKELKSFLLLYFVQSNLTKLAGYLTQDTPGGKIEQLRGGAHIE